MSDWFPPTEMEYGDDCLRCFAPDLAPLKFYVQFSEIKIGNLWIPAFGMPPNNLYELTQVPASPCRYHSNPPPNYVASLQNNAGSTLLAFEIIATINIFWSNPAIECFRHFEHWNQADPNSEFYGGVAQVFTAEEIWDFVEDVTPVVDPDPLLKVSPVAGQRQVISYIDRWGDTKIKILVDLNP